MTHLLNMFLVLFVTVKKMDFAPVADQKKLTYDLINTGTKVFEAKSSRLAGIKQSGIKSLELVNKNIFCDVQLSMKRETFQFSSIRSAVFRSTTMWMKAEHLVLWTQTQSLLH